MLHITSCLRKFLIFVSTVSSLSSATVSVSAHVRKAVWWDLRPSRDMVTLAGFLHKQMKTADNIIDFTCHLVFRGHLLPWKLFMFDLLIRGNHQHKRYQMWFPGWSVAASPLHRSILGVVWTLDCAQWSSCPLGLGMVAYKKSAAWPWSLGEKINSAHLPRWRYYSHLHPERFKVG